MLSRNVNDEYFEWLIRLVCGRRFSKGISYRCLLSYLYETPFTYIIPRDQNRESDGINLRRRFIINNGYEDWYENTMAALGGPCSVLELMIALSIRCEESIMDDPNIGDRTGQWFWGMINNLDLSSMSDDVFDEHYVEDKVQRFLNRDYEPDGRGSLFTIKGCDTDLRTVEIWYQLCWYLNTIT